MPELFTEAEVRAKLKEEIAYTGSEAAFARMIGVSRSHMNRIVRGEKPVYGRVLKWLGFKAITMYKDR